MMRIVKTILAGAFALVTMIAPAFADSTTPIWIPQGPGQYTPVSDTSSTVLTAPASATYAVVCTEGSNHRYTWDGSTTPTASVGTLLAQGSCISLYGKGVITSFRIIQVSAGGTFTASYAK